MERTLFGNRAGGAGAARRRRLSPAWLAPLLVLALWAGSAKAQSTALVSNLGQSTSSVLNLAGHDYAQKFATGGNGAGYTLTGVEVRLRGSAGTDEQRAAPRVRVVGRAAAGTGPDVVATLTAAKDTLGNLTTENIAYAAPPGTMLDPSTEYWVVVEKASSGGVRTNIAYTFSDAEDGGAAAGWSIDDAGLQRAAASTGSFGPSSTWAFMIRVNGSARAGTGGPPVAAASSVRTGPDTAYRFTVDDFRFTDPDGDALASVKIETLPASDKGMLTLGGNAVAAGRAVARSDIEAGNLRYAPPAGAAGEDFARFTFKVNDGTADSAAAATMTVHIGTVANRPPVAAAASVRTRPDTAYAFRAVDFRYSDADGDALASVRIETLPAAGRGALTLGGAAVVAGQAVARSDIDAGRLRYAPPAGGAGEDFARFAFRVNDGTADSADAYTMTAPGGANCLT